MKAMVLNKVCSLKNNLEPLELTEVPVPSPKEGEVLLKVATCGVCHTELDEIEGRIKQLDLPIIPGHQVVGRVTQIGKYASKFKLGDRLGVAWIHSACGDCNYCLKGDENLCDKFLATGKDVNGGYADYMTVPEKYAYPIPDFYSDFEAAPLLCAGAIGYRSIVQSKFKAGQSMGLTGFGSSAHLILKLLKFQAPGSKFYVFARKKEEQEFAIKLGATWAGDITDKSPVKLDCIIDTTPIWTSVVVGLANLKKGGRIVINAIRKEEIDKQALLLLSYEEHLWMEKEIKTIANITAKDVGDFLELAAKAKIKPVIETYSLSEANKALLDIKTKRIKGGKVLQISI